MKNEAKGLYEPIFPEDEAQAQPAIRTMGFANPKNAWTILNKLAFIDRQGFDEIYPYLQDSLSRAADPDRSLVNFERFQEKFGSELYRDLAKSPRIIEMLITLFSVSPFLTETLLRIPDALELLNQRQYLSERKTIEQFQNETLALIRPLETATAKLEALRRYQRRQILRIGTSDFLGLFDIRTVLSQLSRMAAGLVRTCLWLASQETGVPAADFSVLAMGKLGGWELNYSSDIDLVFIVKQDSEEHNLLAKKLVDNLARSTTEGFLYRIDLRLRPWGHDGPLVNTKDSHLLYMKNHARLWEKQAFIKSRVVAGNTALGEELKRAVEPIIFNTPAEEVRSNVLAMKLRTEEFLREKGRRWGEVKLGEGSIRDVEFVVQTLQMTHPPIKTRATLKAIHLLNQDGLIGAADARSLNDGYIFLRTTEHYLQMIDYRQTYTLPGDKKSLALLARRLGFEGDQAGEEFVERYEQHCQSVRSIFMKYVGKESAKAAVLSMPAAPQVTRHLSRMDASYAATFSESEIQQHAHVAELISKEQPVRVNAARFDPRSWRVTVIGYDTLGEFSLICGLLFVYGMDILDSQIFSYEAEMKPIAKNSELEKGSRLSPAVTAPRKRKPEDALSNRQKIVDVFTVRHVGNDPPDEGTWKKYEEELIAFFQMLEMGKRREAQGELAKRVGKLFHETQLERTPLYPIEIEIDNEASSRYTMLNIETQDTTGFLYEFSNALALNHINIVRMDVRSIGKKVKDTIFVNDEKREKITSPEKQRELRAAIVLIKHFTHLLPQSPNPEAALLHFREFLGQLFSRPNWPDELTKIDRPEVLEALAQMLGVSDFLWDDFLRMQYSNLFPIVRDVDGLATAKDRKTLQKELEQLPARGEAWCEAINLFKDREMFRIDMRHILGQSKEFWDFSSELTELVELVLKNVYTHCYEAAREKYGDPEMEDGRPCPAALFALGKFGGKELGFASDIELMLIYGGNGKTGHLKPIATHTFFEGVLEDLIRSIHARQEGIFHIDLQLRPYGKAGSTAVMLQAFQRYYKPGGPAWAYERQALVKLRPAAGDLQLGQEVCRLRDEFVYHGDPFDVTAMRAMRERQLRHLVSADIFNAKYSPGGLVDLEYLVQGLQILHGAEHATVHLTNTREALAALAEVGILAEEDHRRLRKAHTFLHWLIDSLRVVRGNTKDVNIPPYESEEFEFLARRLRYGNDKERLREDLGRYPTEVQEMNLRLLG